MSKLKETIKTIQNIKKQNHISYLKILKDFFICKKKYRASLQDYYLFNLPKRNNFERKTYLTEGINKEYIKKYNNFKYKINLKNRVQFNHIFSKYLNRDWLELKENNFEEFLKFCEKHQTIIIRQNNKQKSIELKNHDLKKLYKKLVNYGKVVIESEIKTCQTIERLQPNSQNVVRIVTLLGSVVMASLEVGNQTKQVNFTKDSIVANINKTTGKIEYPAVNKNKELFTKHPLTKKQIKGIKIPKWETAKELCEMASIEIPSIGYVEWILCIGQEKCHLLGVNPLPSYYLYQIPTHIDNKVGALPLLKEMEKKIEE